MWHTQKLISIVKSGCEELSLAGFKTFPGALLPWRIPEIFLFLVTRTAYVHCAASFHVYLFSLQFTSTAADSYSEHLCVTDGETEAWGAGKFPRPQKESGQSLD